MEVFVQNFYKVMNGLQIAQVIVVDIHTDAEVETRIASIYNFEIAKLHDGRREKGKWSVNVLRFTQLGITSTKLVCLASRTVTTACTSSISFCFSSSSKFMYHLARRVLPARFCMSINRI